MTGKPTKDKPATKSGIETEMIPALSDEVLDRVAGGPGGFRGGGGGGKFTSAVSPTLAPPVANAATGAPVIKAP